MVRFGSHVEGQGTKDGGDTGHLELRSFIGAKP